MLYFNSCFISLVCATLSLQCITYTIGEFIMFVANLLINFMRRFLNTKLNSLDFMNRADWKCAYATNYGEILCALSISLVMCARFIRTGE